MLSYLARTSVSCMTWHAMTQLQTVPGFGIKAITLKEGSHFMSLGFSTAALTTPIVLIFYLSLKWNFSLELCTKQVFVTRVHLEHSTPTHTEPGTTTCLVWKFSCSLICHSISPTKNSRFPLHAPGCSAGHMVKQSRCWWLKQSVIKGGEKKVMIQKTEAGQFRSSVYILISSQFFFMFAIQLVFSQLLSHPWQQWLMDLKNTCLYVYVYTPNSFEFTTN